MAYSWAFSLLGPLGAWGRDEAPGNLVFAPHSEISEITSIKKEDVISTLQYLNLINYYKVGRQAGETGVCRGAVCKPCSG